MIEECMAATDYHLRSETASSCLSRQAENRQTDTTCGRTHSALGSHGRSCLLNVLAEFGFNAFCFQVVFNVLFLKEAPEN